MKPCRYILLLLLLLSSFTYSYAQKTENPKMTVQKDYMFKREMVGGLRLTTTGLGFYLQYGLIKNIYKTHLFMLEYEWHIDYRDKTIKAQPYYSQSGRDYYFGIQNRFHVIRFSYGFEKALADKAARNGVRLSWVGFVGGALGLIKPYYLNLQYKPEDGDIRSERYSAANAAKFLDKNSIDEAAPIYKGMDQMQPVFGGHIRTGLNFDWGSRDAFVKCIEAGVAVDVFYKKIPIYVNDDNNQFFFFGLYLGFHIGKRW